MVRLLTFLICFMGSSVFAQEIEVRTGDHPSFTRIVFTIPSGTNWDISRTEMGYAVQFDTVGSLQVSDFFSLIQRNRIREVSVIGGGSILSLTLNCDCFPEAYLWRDSHLVVDIKDVDQVRTEAYDTSFEKALKLNKLTERVVSNPHPPLVVGTKSAARSSANEFEAISLTLDPMIERPLARTNGILDPFDDLLEQQKRVGMLESAIAGGLQRGLSQGLLQRAENGEGTHTQQANLKEQEADSDLTTLLEEVNAALTPGLTARTSVESAIGAEISRLETSLNEASCFPDDYVDIQNWATDLPFHLQIGLLRSEITSEFDKTDPLAVEALSKAYLYFGFGREAIDALAIDGQMSHRRRALVAIGQIIDGDPIDFPEIHDQLLCSGPAALWGFMAHEDGPLRAELDPEGITVAFKTLPEVLRKHLAPDLARRLNERNLHDFGEKVLSVVSENDKSDIETQLALSEISISQGNTEDAEGLLEELADDNARMTPEALISLISLKVENGNLILPSELNLLRAMQFESQNEEDLGILIRAEAMALAQNQDFDALLELIQREEKFFAVILGAEYKNQVMQYSLDNETDSQFLKRVFQEETEPTDSQLQNSIAQRLIDLGFLTQAEIVVSDPAIGADMEERRYLRAAISATRKDPTMTKAHLAGMNTPRAIALLAEAGGRVNDAQLQELSDVQRSEINWRSANWEQLRTSDDPLLQSVAETISSTPVDPISTETPLSASSSLISESEGLRINMADLLDRFAVTSE